MINRQKRGELVNEYLESIFIYKGLSKQTIRGYKSAINLYLKFSGINNAKDISKKSFEEWLKDGKLDKMWSPKTTKNYMKVWVAFLDWLIEKDIIKENFMRQIPIPKQLKKIPKYLSKKEAETLLEWTELYPYSYNFNRYRAIAMIGCFLLTGIRKSELRDMFYRDVNMEERTIKVINRKSMKERIIPINLKLHKYFKDYIKERRRLKKKSPYFFTAMREDSQMGDLVIKRLVAKIRGHSNINFHPHMLRHTFAVLMLEGGCDLFSLSKLLGHSDIKTTSIYLSATTHHLKKQMIKHPLNF